ncbi:MAG: TSUP family transporter [Comamonadaceae bacterium]|nr:TSUP family transporter [Comamonadaceae bacterium]
MLIALVGLAVGFLAGLLGVGGGIFIVPFMVYVLKYPTKIAAGSAHLIISFSALAGILGHADLPPFRPALDPGDRHCRSHRRKSRSQGQHEDQYQNDQGRSGLDHVGLCSTALVQAVGLKQLFIQPFSKQEGNQ